MRIHSTTGPVGELQFQQGRLHNEKDRLIKQYKGETDQAIKHQIQLLIAQKDEEIRKLEHDMALMKERFFSSDNLESYPAINERPYDVLFCSHPAEQKFVLPIAQRLEGDEHLNILLYGMEEELDEIYLVRSVAVFIGNLQPWRDIALSRILRSFTRHKTPMVNVILENHKEELSLPKFLKSNRFVDFRKQDPDPYKELEKLIKTLYR